MGVMAIGILTRESKMQFGWDTDDLSKCNMVHCTLDIQLNCFLGFFRSILRLYGGCDNRNSNERNKNAIPFNLYTNFLFFRLSYKYSRLVDSGQSRGGELPAADVCAYEEGEEDDEDDQVREKWRNFDHFKFNPANSRKVTVFLID